MPCRAVPLQCPLSPHRAGAGLRALLEELESLVRGRLPAVLGELCRQRGEAEPGAGLLGAVVALPERLSNALQGGHHPSVFLPQNYFPLLAAAIVEALHEVAAALRGGERWGGWGRAPPGGFRARPPFLAFETRITVSLSLPFTFQTEVPRTSECKVQGMRKMAEAV